MRTTADATACTICLEEFYQSNQPPGNIFIATCCKMHLHKNCMIATFAGKNLADRTVKECMVCRVQVGYVEIKDIFFKGGQETTFVNQTDEENLKGYLRKNNPLNPNSIQTNSLLSLFEKEMKRFDKYLMNERKSEEDIIEPFPVQACILGSVGTLSYILKRKPECAGLLFYDCNLKKSVPLLFTSAANNNKKCVDKLLSINNDHQILNPVRESWNQGEKSINSDALSYSLELALENDNITVLNNLAEKMPDNKLSELMQRIPETKVKKIIDQLTKDEYLLQSLLIDAIQEEKHEIIFFFLDRKLSYVKEFIIKMAKLNQCEILKDFFCVSVRYDLLKDVLPLSIDRNIESATVAFINLFGLYTVLSHIVENKKYFLGVWKIVKDKPEMKHDIESAFMESVEKEHLDLVEGFISLGVDRNAGKVEWSKTPLFKAIHKKNNKLILSLLNSDGSDGDQYLKDAFLGVVRCGKEEDLRQIFKSGLILDKKVKGITSAVSSLVISQSNDHGHLQNLLKKVINCMDEDLLREFMCNVARLRDQNVLAALIESGVDIKKTLRSGLNLLHLLARKGDECAVFNLVNMGADIYQPTNNRSKKSALELAHESCHDSLVEKLVSTIPGDDLFEKIKNVIELNDINKLRILIKLQRMFSVAFHERLLHFAVENNRTDVLGIMSELAPFKSAIFWVKAFNKRDQKTISKLMKAKIGIDQTKHPSHTLMAIFERNNEIIKLFIQNGGDITTEFCKVAEINDVDSVSMILESFSDPQAKNNMINKAINQTYETGKNHYFFSALVQAEHKYNTVGIGNIIASVITQYNNALVDANPIDKPKAEKYLHIISSLILAGAEFHMTDDSRKPILHHAIESTNTKILNTLLCGDQINKASLNNDAKVAVTKAFMFAIKQNKLDMVFLIWEKAQKLIDKKHVCETENLLTSVVANKQVEIIRILVSMDYPIIPDLNLSICHNNSSLCSVLVNAGIKITRSHTEDYQHPFTMASESEGSAEIFQSLLSLTDSLPKTIAELVIKNEAKTVSYIWDNLTDKADKLLPEILDQFEHSQIKSAIRVLKASNDIAQQLPDCLYQAALEGKEWLVGALLDSGVELNYDVMPAEFLCQTALKSAEVTSKFIRNWINQRGKELVGRIIEDALLCAEGENENDRDTIMEVLQTARLNCIFYQSSP